MLESAGRSYPKNSPANKQSGTSPKMACYSLQAGVGCPETFHQILLKLILITNEKKTFEILHLIGIIHILSFSYFFQIYNANKKFTFRISL
jgi:hypothetical protein